MFASLRLPAVLAVTLSSLLTHAFPTESSIWNGERYISEREFQLEARNNNYHLNCSNAPGIVAGYQVNAGDVVIQPQLPPSGSNQRWEKYLWCTVGTSTYTFFNYGGLNPQPQGYYNVYQAFVAGVADVALQVANQGGDGNVPSDGWSLKPANTGVSMYAYSAVGTLTWGILHASLSGMMEAAMNYNNLNAPMLFQINDYHWGQVGNGMAGLIYEKNQACIYDFTPEVLSPCSDVQAGKVTI